MNGKRDWARNSLWEFKGVERTARTSRGSNEEVDAHSPDRHKGWRNTFTTKARQTVGII